MNSVVNDFPCRDGVATGFANLYGIDDSGCLRGLGLTLGFRGDRIVLEPLYGCASRIEVCRTQGIGPVRTGMPGGIVSMTYPTSSNSGMVLLMSWR